LEVYEYAIKLIYMINVVIYMINVVGCPQRDMINVVYHKMMSLSRVLLKDSIP
jgi:hypothetical protein